MLYRHAISGLMHDTREEIEAPVYSRREESFTVHLGKRVSLRCRDCKDVEINR